MKFEYYYITKLDRTTKELLNSKGVDQLDIEDVFSDTNLSKVEVKENYSYIALQLPEYNRETKFFEKKQIQMFVGKDYVILTDENEYKNMTFFEKQRLAGNIICDSTTELAFEAFDFLVTRLIRIVNKMRDEVFDIEKSIFTFESTRDLILEIQILKKNIINFQSLIFPLQEVLDELEVSEKMDQHKYQIDDIYDKTSKMLNNLANFKEQIALLTETNEILIARSTNEIVKTMTFVSIFFNIPVLIVGFFGMNIEFGFDKSRTPLISIIIAIVICNFIAFLVFKKKKWL